MDPKYRVWSKTEKKMLKHIQEINFEAWYCLLSELEIIGYKLKLR